ncbi:hypothetical protein [Streptomyces sp. NPDC046985]|uniref:hypothetical protein n=1 Tax=Streptomyces sp. NPDC046985 TaxID=3155377 RepID=UPI003401A8DB
MAEQKSSSILTAPLHGAAAVLRRVPGAGLVGKAAQDTLDRIGAVSPKGRRFAVYTGAGVLGVAGLVEWPIALTGAAVAWLTQSRPADVHDGEAIEGAAVVQHGRIGGQHAAASGAVVASTAAASTATDRRAARKRAAATRTPARAAAEALEGAAAPGAVQPSAAATGAGATGASGLKKQAAARSSTTVRASAGKASSGTTTTRKATAARRAASDKAAETVTPAVVAKFGAKPTGDKATAQGQGDAAKKSAKASARSTAPGKAASGSLGPTARPARTSR